MEEGRGPVHALFYDFIILSRFSALSLPIRPKV